MQSFDFRQAFVLYPFCDCGATIDNECSHSIYNQLRSLPFRRIARPADALTCVGFYFDGTLNQALLLPCLVALM